MIMTAGYVVSWNCRLSDPYYFTGHKMKQSLFHSDYLSSFCRFPAPELDSLPPEVTVSKSPLDKPLYQLTDDDISQLTREDCRRYLKQKGNPLSLYSPYTNNLGCKIEWKFLKITLKQSDMWKICSVQGWESRHGINHRQFSKLYRWRLSSKWRRIPMLELGRNFTFLTPILMYGECVSIYQVHFLLPSPSIILSSFCYTALIISSSILWLAPRSNNACLYDNILNNSKN